MTQRNTRPGAPPTVAADAIKLTFHDVLRANDGVTLGTISITQDHRGGVTFSAENLASDFMGSRDTTRRSASELVRQIAAELRTDGRLAAGDRNQLSQDARRLIVKDVGSGLPPGDPIAAGVGLMVVVVVAIGHVRGIGKLLNTVEKIILKVLDNKQKRPQEIEVVIGPVKVRAPAHLPKKKMDSVIDKLVEAQIRLHSAGVSLTYAETPESVAGQGPGVEVGEVEQGEPREQFEHPNSELC